MLDSVRCGFPMEETVGALKERVFTGSIYEKYHELEQQGKTPVCLFPTRLACHKFNTQMLNSLNTPIQEMKCSDTIDEPSSPASGLKEQTKSWRNSIMTATILLVKEHTHTSSRSQSNATLQY